LFIVYYVEKLWLGHILSVFLILVGKLLVSHNLVWC
jgi:hypothetical protein